MNKFNTLKTFFLFLIPTLPFHFFTLSLVGKSTKKSFISGFI